VWAKEIGSSSTTARYISILINLYIYISNFLIGCSSITVSYKQCIIGHASILIENYFFSCIRNIITRRSRIESRSIVSNENDIHRSDSYEQILNEGIEMEDDDDDIGDDRGDDRGAIELSEDGNSFYQFIYNLYQISLSYINRNNSKKKKSRKIIILIIILIILNRFILQFLFF
jgi:hypothetical protein